MNPFSAAPRFAALALACTTLVIAACGKENGAAPAKPAALAVAVKHVEPQRVPIVFDAVGQAEGSREVEIRARVPGIIEKRLYNEGTSVKAGQTLFIIDRAQYEIAAAQAQAALSQEKARQEQFRREAERLKSLAGSRAISQREYEEAVSAFRQSSAAIEGAEAKVAEAKLNLSYTSVSAPISGIASRALRSEGSLVAANTDLLTTLTQVNPIWVRFSLAESDFEKIRGKSRNARISILNRDGSVAAGNGRINFLGSTIDAKLGTVQLRAEFPNADMQWLPGQFLKVQILAGEQEAFLVPQAAVTQTEQGYSVWLAEDGKANAKMVKTANWIGSDWIVTSGLKTGDAVIVDNLMKLRPGAAVEPRKAGTAPGAPATDTPANKPATAH